MGCGLRRLNGVVTVARRARETLTAAGGLGIDAQGDSTSNAPGGLRLGASESVVDVLMAARLRSTAHSA